MTTILRTDPLPTIVICCPLDELDARLAALMAALYTLTTTGAAVATGEARQTPVVAEAEAVECPA